MSFLYKKSNWLWRWLIRSNATAHVWRPLVEWTRLRHVRFRRQLLAREGGAAARASSLTSAGV